MKQFRTPHKHGKCFYNYSNETHDTFLTKLFMITYNVRSFRRQHGRSNWIVEPVLHPVEPHVPVVTWIGHSSFLLRLGGYSVLFDPVFGNISPVYPRLLPAALQVDQLEQVDFVVISHNHRDHMDATSLLAIKRRFPHATIVVPEGNGTWFTRRGFSSVQEFSWWQSQVFQAQLDVDCPLKLTCLPAAHWSQRLLLDKNRALWSSWLVECAGKSLYFAGDTYYEQHFCEIAQAYPSIDIALLPIGPAEPREWLRKSHIGPDEAGLAFLELGARHMVPMHWGAFPFGGERFDLPLDLLCRWWEKNGDLLADKQLHCLKVGQTQSF